MSRRDNDIKAPDGFLLGGFRKVRRDATILFHRRWWKLPEDWIGERVHVHVLDCYGIDIEVAPPGLHVWDQNTQNLQPDAVDRPDAKPGWRSAHMKAWSSRDR